MTTGRGSAVTSLGVSRAGALAWAAFAVSAVLAAFPLINHASLPLVDLPNHVARLHVAAGQGGPLAEYYTYHLGLDPNSAADLLWAVWPDRSDPARFSQVLMALYPVALIAAAMVLGRVAHGRWTCWPAAVALVAYNANFYWGFQNYLLAVPPALAALALWMAWEERSPLRRMLAFLPIAALLYLFHLFGFVILAVGAMGRELQRVVEARGDRIGQLLRSLPLAMPFLPPLAWHVAQTLSRPPSSLALLNFAPGGSGFVYGSMSDRLSALVSPTMAAPVFGEIRMPPDGMPPLVWAGIASLIFLVGCLLTLLRRRGPRLRVERRFVGPVLALAVVVLLAPTWLNGVSMVHIRLPFVALAVLVAATSWQGLGASWARGLAAVALLLLTTTVTLFDRLASRHDSEMRELTSLLEALPRGARMLPVRAQGDELDTRMWHAAAYAVVQRDAFIPTLFQGSHGLSVAPAWSDSSHPAMYAPDYRRLNRGKAWSRTRHFEFLRDWDSRFTFVLLLDPIEEAQRSWGPPLAQVGRFALYRATDVAAGMDVQGRR